MADCNLFSPITLRGLTLDNRIVLSPNWPKELGPLGFAIHYRGHHVHVRVSGRGAEVSVAPRDMPPVMIECHGRVEQIQPGCTMRFPAPAAEGGDDPPR